PTEGEPAGGGRYIHPAFFNVTYIDSQNASPSSAPWEMATLYRCPPNGATALATNCWRSGPSVLGALKCSKSDRACLACSSAAAILSLENCSRTDASLIAPTVPTTTATAPITKIPLDKLNSQSAVSEVMSHIGT